MSYVEQAVVALTDRCDGASNLDSRGWNKFDAKFGHSIANRLKNGRVLSVAQRRVVAKILLKYHRQFDPPLWAKIEKELPVWKDLDYSIVLDDRPLPRLEFDRKEERFFLYTKFEHREMVRTIPSGRWREKEKAWRFMNYYDTRERLLNLWDEKWIKSIDADTKKILEQHRAAKERKAQAEKKVHIIKTSTDQLPLISDVTDVELYQHQLKAYHVGITLDASAILMVQRAGKTFSAIAVITKRYQQKQVKRVLISTVVSAMCDWEDNFKECCIEPHRVEVLSGSMAERAAILDSWEDTEGIQVAVVNHDAGPSLVFDEKGRPKGPIIDWAPDMVIIDESQKIKNPKAMRSQAMHKLGDVVKYKMILSGTPVTQSPLDLWSQYRFLDPTIFGTSFSQFKKRYAQMGGYGSYKVVGYNNLEELAAKAHSIAYRVSKEEAGIPESEGTLLYVDLEPEVMDLYKKLAKEAILKLGEEKVTAPIILTKLLRLQQVAGGFVKTESGTWYEVSRAKRISLRTELEQSIEAGEKIFIVARFIPEIEAISKMLTEMKINHVTLTGRVKKSKDRKRDQDLFQKNPNVKVFLAQIQTGGVAITLSAADHIIFYSWNFSFTDYDQAKSRPSLMKKKKAPKCTHIVADNTIDEDIIQALQEKQDVAKMVVDDLKNLVIPRLAEIIKN